MTGRKHAAEVEGRMGVTHRFAFANVLLVFAVACAGKVTIHGVDVASDAITAAPTPTSQPTPSAPVMGAGAALDPGAVAPGGEAPQPGGKPGRGCTAESDAELCERLGKSCGALKAVDACGASRKVASCGACEPPQVCGGAGDANACGELEPATRENTLVIVRHGQSRANACTDACPTVACCPRYPCVAGCSDCYCDAFQNDLTEHGWEQVQDVLPDRLAALDMKWDQILVSPAWRTQTTIKAYLERHALEGQLVPEIEECSMTTRCSRGATCTPPPWSDEPYDVIEFEDDEPHLSPRPHRPGWDPDPGDNPRPRYDHAAARVEGERVIMDRGAQYIEEQFTSGASIVLVVTHHDVGRGLLQRLTGTSDSFSLENAAAYTILKRAPGEQVWSVEVLNDE